MSEMLLVGTHGTSRTRADNIKRIGFNASKCGRHGKGTYMWCAEDDPKDAIELAYHFAKTLARQYEDDNDPSPKVLKCNIRLNGGIYMDLDGKDYYDMFKAHLRKNANYLLTAKGSKYVKASRVVDSFVRHIEEITNNHIKVVRTKTQVPRSYLTEHLKLPHQMPDELRWLDIQSASCYIVRDFTCIPASEIEIN